MKKHSPLTAVCGMAIALAAGRSSAGADNNGVPAALNVPAGQVLVLTAHGAGVQIYECTPSKDEPMHYAWTFKAPEAELRYISGKQIGKHYAGPTWEARDGSKVIGDVVAKGDSPDPSAIPWLLLRAKSTVGNGVFGAILSIQRLHTVGGKAPDDGCGRDQIGQQTRVPYSAEYLFYAAAP